MQFSFENHVVDVKRRELKRGGEAIALEPQVFDLLVYLLQNRDRVVSRDDLIASVWGGRIVSDSALDSRINAVRKAIGDSGGQQKFIRTFARKGIRFVAAVTEKGEPRQAAHPASTGERPALAVLPFQNLSGDPAQEYFADGLSEDLIVALGRWCRFPVIARHSSFSYKGRTVDIAQAARELGARYLVEGSVRKSGDRLRITAQLIDAATGHHLWSDRYDRSVDDIFAIQDEITTRIAAAIEPELEQSEEHRASEIARGNLTAYDLVQRGNWHHNKFTPADFEKARRLFAAAIEVDRNYAPAHASMAYTMYWSAQMRCVKDSEATLQAAQEFARRAVVLDETNPQAHMYLGQISLWLRQHDDAVAETRRAIELNPSLAHAYSVLGYALLCIGEFEEAIQTVTRSLRLRPIDRTLARCIPSISFAHYLQEAYGPAEEVARRAVAMNPIYWLGHQALAASLGQLGRKDEGAQKIAEIRGREPEISRNAYSGRLPFRNPVYAQRIEDGLIKAGWRD